MGPDQAISGSNTAIRQAPNRAVRGLEFPCTLTIERRFRKQFFTNKNPVENAVRTMHGFIS